MTRHRSATSGGPPRFAAGLLFCLALALPGSLRAQDAIERSFAVALIRDTMAAIGHGTRTGNYTVLRDLASPDMAAQTDPLGLATLLDDLRGAGVDLLPAMVIDPVILSERVADTQDQLRLTGYLPLEPRFVSFDLVYQLDAGRWRLRDLSVGTFEPIPTPAAPPVSP